MTASPGEQARRNGQPQAAPEGNRTSGEAASQDGIPVAALHERLGIKIVEASALRVVGVMPVSGNTQPFGVLHGGASCALAEGLASLAASLHAGPERLAVGVDLNATHHRGVTAGVVTGVATPIHLGRQVASYSVSITDDQGRAVCTARLTCYLRPAPRSQGAPDVG